MKAVAFVSPPPLEPGSRVALIAPAGPLRNPGELDQAMANARGFGWEPVPGAHVLARHGYLGGTDEQRLSDLNGAIRDPAIDGIWCVRGGYGVLRLLARLDAAALRGAPKALIGFSDITALHAAIGRCAGVVTYHGPTARAPLDGLSRELLSDPEFARMVEGDLRDGHHRNATARLDYFTTAYLHWPEELERETVAAGFAVQGLYGVEGPGWILPDFDERWNDAERREALLRVARALESVPSTLGSSAHLIVVGQKP